MQEIARSDRGKSALREEIIIDALTGALEELNRGETYVRTFRFKKGKRTTHMLVFVTKHPLGYRVMTDIMAKEGHVDGRGIPHFTHYDKPPQTNQLFYPEFDKLKEDLCEKYAGKTKTMMGVFEEHSLRRDYISSNYKDALNELEDEGRISVDPPASKRRVVKGKRTFKDEARVTFPPRKK
jgi:hypothetical protein